MMDRKLRFVLTQKLICSKWQKRTNLPILFMILRYGLKLRPPACRGGTKEVAQVLTTKPIGHSHHWRLFSNRPCLWSLEERILWKSVLSPEHSSAEKLGRDGTNPCRHDLWILIQPLPSRFCWASSIKTLFQAAANLLAFKTSMESYCPHKQLDGSIGPPVQWDLCVLSPSGVGRQGERKN